MEVLTIRKEAKINGKDFPMFVGYASAEEILKFAYVPSFASDEEHHKIASMLYKTPVDEWQRPLDTPNNRTDIIKGIFSDTTKDNLMCNPVLLGLSNQISAGKVSAIPELASGTIDGKANTDIWKIKLKANGKKKPLWIIDGQHRLHGLVKSKQMNNPIPMVFLVEQNKTHYDENFMAEVFTQVTSGAEPLAPLHQFWMEYCFNMGSFAKPEMRESFDFVKELCSEANIPKANYPTKGKAAGPANNFSNRIKFNPYDDDYGYRTISWNVQKWTELVYNEYYGNSPITKLGYEELVVNFTHFLRAAEKLDPYVVKSTSRLFCKEHRQTTVIETMVVEYFRYIAKNDSCNGYKQSDWEDFLKMSGRNFHTSDWEMSAYHSAGKGSFSSTYGAQVNDKGLKNMFHHLFRGTVTADPISHLGIQSPSIYFKGSAHPRTGTPPNDRWSTAKAKVITENFPGSGSWDITANSCKGVKFSVLHDDYHKSNVTLVRIEYKDNTGP